MCFLLVVDCNGDSGGPVFVSGLQVGIVSFGYGGCASATYQDVYVDVAEYADWIRAYVDGENCKPSEASGLPPPTEDTIDDAATDDEEPSDIDSLLDCFTTVIEMVNTLLGGENAKGNNVNNNNNNKGGDKDNADQDKVGITVGDILWGRDGPDGPAPGLVGRTTMIIASLNPFREGFKEDVETIGKSLGVDEGLARATTTNTPDGGR